MMPVMSQDFGVVFGKVLIAPFAFIVSLFNSNVNIYEVHNRGGFYNFGFLMGVAIFFGGAGSSSS